ncbi:pirin family protein [Lacihabitans sp. LS3-19]|uniref:pirin family protein n=1 Tax=Lacihabitans sp. LS3-19 TaxID=2487335 RepID=UPI0020CEE45B|nr:pirin family protein [Lacihabitans sp. LS3-19]
MKKEILKISSSSGQRVGEHRMYQPIPDVGLEQISPFILLHHHGPHDFAPHNQGLPFGPHPHRGFETLTFIYDGEIEHADGHGHSSVIKSGGVQWMTAARGIVHSENLSPKQRQEGGKMEIIQLWMNLPARLKMTEAKYQGFQKEEIPVVLISEGKVEVAVVSGEFEGMKGAANSITGLEMYNIKMLANSDLKIEVVEDKNILFYVLDGEIIVNGKLAIGHQLLVFDAKNTEIEIKSQADSRFIFGTGDAINEPVVSQGPFVMNTTTEIMEAMRDYQMGKMGVM